MDVIDWETMPSDVKLVMLIHWLETITDKTEDLYRTDVIDSKCLVDMFAVLGDAKQILVDLLTGMRT